MLKVEVKQESQVQFQQEIREDKTYAIEDLKKAWQQFADKRKHQQIDYFLLSQEFEVNGNQITIPLANPVQETMLNEFRSDLITHLRESLQNYSINVIGELRLPDEKKMVYTNKDKLAFLINKNPAIAELKDKLGLDPDY